MSSSRELWLILPIILILTEVLLDKVSPKKNCPMYCLVRLHKKIYHWYRLVEVTIILIQLLKTYLEVAPITTAILKIFFRAWIKIILFTKIANELKATHYSLCQKKSLNFYLYTLENLLQKLSMLELFAIFFKSEIRITKIKY